MLFRSLSANSSDFFSRLNASFVLEGVLNDLSLLLEEVLLESDLSFHNSHRGIIFKAVCAWLKNSFLGHDHSNMEVVEQVF